MVKRTPEELAALKALALKRMLERLQPAIQQFELYWLLFGPRGLPRYWDMLPRLAMRRLRELRGIPESKAYWTRFQRAGITEEYWLALVEAFGSKCAYCLQPCATLTIDHVTPKMVGGQGGPGDVVPACGPCNSRKQHRSLDWMVRRMKINRTEFDARLVAARAAADTDVEDTKRRLAQAIETDD